MTPTLTDAAKAYGFLWLYEGADWAVHNARRLLLAGLTKDEQKRGISFAQFEVMGRSSTLALARARELAEGYHNRPEPSDMEIVHQALLELCSRHGFATGHGDTLVDIIREIDGEIRRRETEVYIRTEMQRPAK